MATTPHIQMRMLRNYHKLVNKTANHSHHIKLLNIYLDIFISRYIDNAKTMMTLKVKSDT